MKDHPGCPVSWHICSLLQLLILTDFMTEVMSVTMSRCLIYRNKLIISAVSGGVESRGHFMTNK